MAKAAKKDAVVNFTEGDSLVVDFNEVEEITFEALPKGPYEVIVAENDFGFSQAGNPMWTLQLEVTEGEHAGRRLFNHLVFFGAGLGFTKTTLGRIAPQMLESPLDPSDEDSIQAMLGIECRAQVTVEKYKDGFTNNIKGLYALSSDSSFV